MARSSGSDAKILQSFRFAGSTSGPVKSLSGFKKSHHTLPDAVNSATSAFLAKLAADEIAEEGERLFQHARTLLAYKRKDLTLDVGTGTAVLSAKDFTYELSYALNENDPAEYLASRSLHSVRSSDFLRTTECDALFPSAFSSVVFLLAKGAPVEKVIDAVEGLDPEHPLKVDYPSDCAHCVLRVAEVEAAVRFDGRELAMEFPRTAAPSELWESFLAVRHAFALSKDKVLAGLISG